ncbi:MAG: gliding motility protein GldN [Dysgonamonadaceae bacterium]|jgi:gliding motility associated protien GldN|nr:gliding motility protein GldN [Dysgonamonadaceae bacterium]
MKTVYYVSLFVVLFAFVQESIAQDATRRTRQRPSAADSSSVFNLTERARIKNETESKKPSHIVWERLIYRTIDLTKEANNAALYYPMRPQSGRQNLFTLIFKLLADGKITAYNYMDGGEVFEDSQKLNVEELLKKLQLLYTKQGNRFIVDERDIPSMEVTQYMIKEGYYFDQATGMFQTNVLAICPILVREDYYAGGLSRETLFWLKYDDIRPYLSREMIMTSNYNNALTYTIDDYFRKTMYTGEIVKTVNMLGKSLAQEVGDDPNALKHARDSIEAQLKAFDENLWVYNDSVRSTVGKVADKKVEKTKTTTVRSSGATGEKAQKEPKAKSSPPKSENAPVRSVRRTR